MAKVKMACLLKRQNGSLQKLLLKLICVGSLSLLLVPENLWMRLARKCSPHDLLLLSLLSCCPLFSMVPYFWVRRGLQAGNCSQSMCICVLLVLLSPEDRVANPVCIATRLYSTVQAGLELTVLLLSPGVVGISHLPSSA